VGRAHVDHEARVVSEPQLRDVDVGERVVEPDAREPPAGPSGGDSDTSQGERRRGWHRRDLGRVEERRVDVRRRSDVAGDEHEVTDL